MSRCLLLMPCKSHPPCSKINLVLFAILKAFGTTIVKAQDETPDAPGRPPTRQPYRSLTMT